MLKSDLTRMTNSPGQSNLPDHLVNSKQDSLLFVQMPRGQEGGRKGAQDRTTGEAYYDMHGERIGMTSATARGIWRQAENLAGSTYLVDILSVLEHKEGAGRPEKVTDGASESAAIRRYIAL